MLHAWKGEGFMQKLNDFFSGIPMTLLGGFCLLCSLAARFFSIALPLDPAWISVFICGVPLLYLSIWRIIYNPGIRKISSALLISVAMIAAISIGDLFAAGEVAFIMALGAILEDKTTARAKKGLRHLLSLTPRQGRKMVDGKEVMVDADQLVIGDVVRILPGETIPADGDIVSGHTSIDQSVLTGESLPVDREAGDAVFCGTLNCFGSIDIVVTKTGADSSLQKLIRMVTDAENKKAPMARIADICASWLVPVALLLAIFAYFFTGNLVRAVTVLVVFCPCALVLATPTAIMAAIGQATKHGIIIKSGEALEHLGKADTIAFDKTGTLTYGRLTVSDIRSFSKEYAPPVLLSLAASAESRSEHPLGKAIVAHAKENGIFIPEASFFHMDAGKGICATADRHTLLCGSQNYLREHGVFLSDNIVHALHHFQEEGKASILIAIDESCAGIIALSDTLRPAAPSVVSALHTLNTAVVLLTGDSKAAAAFFASQTGISLLQSELLPEEKVSAIQTLQQQGHIVCMVGDGINDAPALKAADASIAMGCMGSDIAIETADIALMDDDLSKIIYLKRLSSATVHTIQLSICLSLLINFIAITLSLSGLLTPTTGALVHNAGSLLVVLIAALLYDRKFG